MQKAIEIKSRNLTLRGMLHVPDQINGKVPTVIILHGFGGNKMGPNFIFVKLSRVLEENNIASVRFDFAGSGESDGSFTNMTLSGEIEDAKNILEYVKSLDFTDKENIGVLGYSMGGAVASTLAGSNESDIEALCLWAPAGNIEEIVKNHFIGEGYPEFLQQGYYDIEGLLVGKNFVDDLSKIDIYNIASKYNGNVLLIHGNNDEVVSIEASKKYLQDSYRNNGKLITVDGADHMFGNQLWAKEYIENTVAYFKERIINKRAVAK